MDITEVQDTAELKVRINGEPTDIVITLMGPDHPARTAYERRVGNRSMRAVKKSGKAGAGLPDDVDEFFEQVTERLVALTVGWRNLSRGGTAVPFSQDVAREIYGNRKFIWLRTQVLAFLEEDENFLPISSPAFAPA